MISIDYDLHAEAKLTRLNISAVCEKALRERLGQNINMPKDEQICWRCKSNSKKMIWDGFAEMWICEDCNNSQVKHVSIMAKK